MRKLKYGMSVTCILHTCSQLELILLILVSHPYPPVPPWPCISAHSGSLMPSTFRVPSEALKALIRAESYQEGRRGKVQCRNGVSPTASETRDQEGTSSVGFLPVPTCPFCSPVLPSFQSLCSVLWIIGCLHHDDCPLPRGLWVR